MKNKIIKICSSIGSLLGLFLLFFILFGQSASASTSVTTISYVDTTITIPSYSGENAVLICDAQVWPSYGTADFSVNSVNMTKIKDLPAFNGSQSSISYLINPLIGTYSFANTKASNSQTFCYLFEGVNTTDLIVNTFDDTSNNHIYNGGVNGNALFYVQTVSQSGASPTSSNCTLLGGPSFWAYSSTYGTSFAFWKTVSSSNEVLDLNNYGSPVNGYFVELNTDMTPPSTACTSFTYTAWTQCVPEGNGYFQHRYITGETPTGCNIYDPESVQPVREQSCNPGAIKIQFPYDWKGILYDDSTGIYEQFKYTYNISDIQTGDYIKMFSCNNSNCTDYDELVFDNGYSTTTELNILHPFGISENTYASGTSMFIIPQPVSLGTTTQNVYYRLYLYQDGIDNYTTIRPIYWLNESDYNSQYSNEDIVIPPQVCEMPSYDINDICEGIPSGTLGDIQCGFKFALVSSGQFLFYPTCDSLNYVTGNYNSFKHSFPFNTYFDLTDSMNKAINTSLNSTTTAQNISIPFIRKTATSSEYYMLPVMSSSTITNTIGSTNYSTLKLTFGFIWWLLSAVIVFLIVTKL